MSKISVSIKGVKKYKKLADEFHNNKAAISVEKELWIHSNDEKKYSLTIYCSECSEHFKTEEHFIEAHPEEVKR